MVIENNTDARNFFASYCLQPAPKLVTTIDEKAYRELQNPPAENALWLMVNVCNGCVSPVTPEVMAAASDGQGLAFWPRLASQARFRWSAPFESRLRHISKNFLDAEDDSPRASHRSVHPGVDITDHLGRNRIT